jgi:glutamyl-tRNA synthetase
MLKELKDNLKLPSDFEKYSEEFLLKNELKMPQIGQPLRLAITGVHQAPAIYDILSVVGVDESICRIDKLVKFIKD